jgi:two-component system, NtrC family, nitrogen regulation sensor histidine kinase NtrY
VKQRMRLKFRVLAFVQVLLLVATLCVLAWALVSTDHVAVPVIVGILAVLQITMLLRFVEKHIDTLEEFFHAVHYEDFTQHFVSGDVDTELKQAFNEVIGRFREARADRDVQANYLEVVVRHIPVPLIAVRADGSLRLVNNPARRLTGLASLRHLDELAVLGQDVPARLKAIGAGEQCLLQASLRDVPVELRVAVSEIRIGGDAERLYSIENLSGELTARESSAWRNLIRVLTHEIMNTLTPVSSLAQTSVGLLDRPEAADDVREAIETIARRSDGLMRFVSRYRELLKLPQPSLADVPVEPAVRAVLTLLAKSLGQTDVVVDIRPATLALRADPSLLDQLLLNVVKNAVEALEETDAPAIRISARLEYGRTVLRVADNGPGIPEEAADQLFVPFFTTKREGSGIGLSLGRQIMTAHGGDIAIRRSDGLTVVSLVF